MRLFLNGLAAAFVLFFAAAPASAESVNCPLTIARRSVTNTLPSGWFTTPVESRLTETRVQNVGGVQHMACIYGAAGVVLREFAAGQSCTARSGGFECASGGAPAPAPSSEVYATGTFTIRGTYNVDFDFGREGSNTGAEFWYEVIRSNESYFTPRNGVTYAIMGASEPGYSACTSATYSNARFRIETLSGRPWICVRTNQGRIGEFRIDSVDRVSAPMRMTLTYTVWR